MRKATWGAILLGLFALATMWPISEVPGIHLLTLAAAAGVFLLSMDPPGVPPRTWRSLLIATFAVALASFLLVQVSLANPLSPLRALARVLSVAVVAIPLWLYARWERYVFVAGAAVALATLVVTDLVVVHNLTIPAFGLTVAGAGLVALRLEGRLITGEKKPKRIVVASNIVSLTPAQRAASLARIEKRFRDGEIPEHKYWDLRQELESR